MIDTARRIQVFALRREFSIGLWPNGRLGIDILEPGVLLWDCGCARVVAQRMVVARVLYEVRVLAQLSQKTNEWDHRHHAGAVCAAVRVLCGEPSALRSVGPRE